MRIHLALSSNNNIVPFDHMPVLVGALHKWIGANNLHDETSLYSFSWLQGGKKVSEGLSFPNGAKWFISSYKKELINFIIKGIQSDPYINFGISVKEIIIQETPDFSEKERFLLGGPVLIKRRDQEQVKHCLFSDTDSNSFLSETLKTKLQKAGLNPEGVKVMFDTSYHSPKTKLVTYNGIGNKANMCPVVIEGTKEQVAFAWNVGVGNSTGIGFGALK